MDRLSVRFGAVLKQAIRTFPWLSRVRMAYCPLADREHRKSWRQFSHACHRKDVVCWARASGKDLADPEIDGIAAHEIGHVIGDSLEFRRHRASRGRGKGDRATEMEANFIARMFGVELYYNERGLEEAL